MSRIRFRFYTSSRAAFSAMRSAIALAERSILLEMYIFEEDALGEDFLSELERKAREKVKVVLLLDGLGSFAMSDARVDRLRIAGAEVRFFSRFLKRTHRKILIIDEFTVFMGGVNIARRFSPWRDLELRLSGKRIGESARRSFARVYREAGGRDPFLFPIERERPFARAKLWFIEHGIGHGMALRKHYEERIDGASGSIVLVTPYFIPRRWLIGKLHGALMRGVSVTIIVPQATDHPLIDRVNLRYLAVLQGLGANCLLSLSMNHAKAMLIDRREAIVGSHNLDALSFERNVEGGVFFEDERMVGSLEKIVERWIEEAKPLSNAPKRSWYDPIVAVLLPFFESVL